MPHHHHHHPHAPHPHDRRAFAPSLLRMSLWERLTGAAVLSAAIWGAIFWAVR
jgi:hypothetical protein